MLSGLWYEYLQELDKDMKRQGHIILLITDNCPSHTLADQPPQNYPQNAPPPPPQLHQAHLDKKLHRKISIYIFNIL